VTSEPDAPLWTELEAKRMAQGISLAAPLGNKINVRGRPPAREATIKEVFGRWTLTRSTES
jgi:hypothetical protein